jgi:superoxide dismutase
MKILLKESQYIKLLKEYTDDKELSSIEDLEHVISDEGEFKDILSDDTTEDVYKNKIKTYLNNLRYIIFSSYNSDMSSVEKTFKIINLINKLRRIKNLLNQSVYINIYSNKYGSEYLQARTSQKIDGKTKWINAFVGSVKDFPEKTKSAEALKLGKTLIRKKLEPLYNIS